MKMASKKNYFEMNEHEIEQYLSRSEDNTESNNPIRGNKDFMEIVVDGIKNYRNFLKKRVATKSF